MLIIPIEIFIDFRFSKNFAIFFHRDFKTFPKPKVFDGFCLIFFKSAYIFPGKAISGIQNVQKRDPRTAEATGKKSQKTFRFGNIT